MNRRLLLLSAAGLLACAGPHPQAAPGGAITVFAASSLTDAFTALGTEWERTTRGAHVRSNFAASSTLRIQVEQGGPADVFASADMLTMQPLVDAKLVDKPQVFAKNRLTIVIPATHRNRVRSAQDLSRKGLRLVTTADTVPIGHYTQQMLQKLGTQPGYGGDFLKNVSANIVSQEPNVRAVLTKVELGEADAAVVYESDAWNNRKVRQIPIPDAANITAEYPAAVVAASGQKPLAESFTRFLTSGRGAGIMHRYGFR